MVGIEARGRDLGLQKTPVTAAHGQSPLCGQQCAGHLPAAANHTHELQERHRAGRDRANVLAILLRNMTPGPLQRGDTACEQRAHALRVRARRCGQLGVQRAHLLDQCRQRAAPIATDLAADQVIGLDRCRPFVNSGDAGIAEKLRGSRLFDETHAARTCTPSEATSLPVSVLQPLTIGIIRSTKV